MFLNWGVLEIKHPVNMISLGKWGGMCGGRCYQSSSGPCGLSEAPEGPNTPQVSQIHLIEIPFGI